MDEFTRKHLEAWADRTLYDDERDAVLAAMIALYIDDPAYWAELGWPALRDAVRS